METPRECLVQNLWFCFVVLTKALFLFSKFKLKSKIESALEAKCKKKEISQIVLSSLESVYVLNIEKQNGSYIHVVVFDITFNMFVKYGY